MVLNFLKEAIKRFKSKTPIFWKRVQRLCLSVGAVGGFITVTPYHYPEVVATWAPYFMTVGLFGMFLSQFAKNDTDPQFNPNPTTLPQNNVANPVVPVIQTPQNQNTPQPPDLSGVQ